MRIELGKFQPDIVYICAKCWADVRPDSAGNAYYDNDLRESTTLGVICNHCAEGDLVRPVEPVTTYLVDNAHYVGVSDKRDIVVFDGAEEVRISQRSILNHKKLAVLLCLIQRMLKEGKGVRIASESFLAKKLYAVVEEEENGEAV